MAADVLAEHIAGLALADDARDSGPQVSRVVDPAAQSGAAERLAGIAGNEAMNAATPRSAVEGAGI